MSEKTMLDVSGGAVLEGDPLGLHALEQSLAWNPQGPLPDWLDDADIDDDDQPPEAPVAVPIEFAAGDLAPADAKAEPATISPPRSEGPAEIASDELVSINDILRFVDDDAPDTPPTPANEAPNVSPIPVVARRVVSFEELIDARLCLLTVAADRLWAIPVDRVVAAAGRGKSEFSVDLSERLEGKSRRRPGRSIALADEGAVVVDRLLGPRTIGWEPLPSDSDAPIFALATAMIGGERVALLDADVLFPPRADR